MPFPALGLEERLGLALEAHNAYGVAVAPTNALRYETFGIDLSNLKEPVPGLHGPVRGWRGAVADSARAFTPTRKVTGPLVLPFDFVEMMLPSYNLLCKDNGSGVAIGYTFAAGTGPTGVLAGTNKHLFEMQNHTNDMARAMTLTRFNGQEQHEFTGCYVRSFELTLPESGPAMVNMDILGQNMANDAEALPAYAASPFLALFESKIAYHATIGTARASLTAFPNVLSATLRVSHVYREVPSSGLAVNMIRQPTPIDYSVVELSFRTDWESDTWQDFWRAASIEGSFVCAELQCNSIAAASPETYAFYCRIPAAMVAGKYPAHGGGPGPVPQEVMLEAYVFDNAGSDEICQFEFYNGEATLGL
jgi:hypothetical protein